MEIKVEKRTIKKDGADVAQEGLAIWLPFETRPFPLSGTEMSFTVATTHGVKLTDVIVDGEALNVGVNSFIANRSYVKPPKSARK